MTQSTDTTTMQEQIEEAVERLDSLIAEEIKRASDSEQQLVGKPISMGTGRELHLRLEKLFKKELRTIASKSADQAIKRGIEYGLKLGREINKDVTEVMISETYKAFKEDEAPKQHTTEEVE